MFLAGPKELFRILFLEKNKSKKIVTGTPDPLREIMKADTMPISMTQDERGLLLEKCTHGPASMACTGQIKDSTEHIISTFDKMGSVVITAGIKESRKGRKPSTRDFPHA